MTERRCADCGAPLEGDEGDVVGSWFCKACSEFRENAHPDDDEE